MSLKQHKAQQSSVKLPLNWPTASLRQELSTIARRVRREQRKISRDQLAKDLILLGIAECYKQARRGYTDAVLIHDVQATDQRRFYDRQIEPDSTPPYVGEVIKYFRNVGLQINIYRNYVGNFDVIATW